MAWNVNDIYNLYKKLTRSNQSGRISANDLFYLWNSEQRMYQADLLGRFNNQSNGKSGVNTGVIQNATIMQKLAAFTKTATVAISSGNGNKPTGFVYKLDLRIGDYTVKEIQHSQIPAVKKSVISPPSVANNKYYNTAYQGFFSFLPTTVTSATLDYIEAPTDILWNYTLDGNGRQVYSSGGSVQPQWDDVSIVEITKRALDNLGIGYKDADFQRAGQKAVATGN